MMNKLRRWLLFDKIRGVNQTVYFLRNPPKHVAEYYNFCKQQLISRMGESTNPSKVALLFPQHIELFSRQINKICLQIEHTLVLDGGRGVTEKIDGVTSSREGKTYLTRIDRSEHLRSADVIIEYCQPNIYHVLTSPLSGIYNNKVKYVPPFYESVMTNPSKAFRNKHKVITIMTPPAPGERRFELIQELSNDGISIENFNNMWGGTTELLSQTQILLNLHQTEHHHSIEELRILPAILQGVIVISEEVPLLETIPYSKFFITAPRDALAHTISDTLKKFDEIWASIFESEEFKIYRETQMAKITRTFAEISQENGYSTTRLPRFYSTQLDNTSL